MPDLRAAFAASRPISASAILAALERRAVGLGTGEDIVAVPPVPAAGDGIPLLRQGSLGAQVVLAMQFVEIARDDLPFRVSPRAAADTIARVERRGAGGGTRAEISAPLAIASPWQCRSAPSRPPKSAPRPAPALVTKNVMPDCCAFATPPRTSESRANAAAMPNFIRSAAPSQRTRLRFRSWLIMSYSKYVVSVAPSSCTKIASNCADSVSLTFSARV